MEASAEQEGERDQAHRVWCSPCNFLERLLKACRKCLGHEDVGTEEDAEDSLLLTEAEPVTEEFSTEVIASSVPFRRPPRPPISAGRGGQMN